MRCREIKRIFIPICLSLVVSIFATNTKGQNNCNNREAPTNNFYTRQQGNRIGISGGDTGSLPGDNISETPPKVLPFGTRPLQITSKPRAQYTNKAKQNCIQGGVVLKVTFFANETVGRSKVIEGLGDGLSQQAVESAKKIKFKPELKDNIPITVTKKIHYNFTIY